MGQGGSDIIKWVLVAVALVVGLIGGYYFGSGQAYEKGMNAGVAQEKAAQEAKVKDAEKEAVKAVNPFEQTTTNPFEKSSTNPFENVKVNPFE